MTEDNGGDVVRGRWDSTTRTFTPISDGRDAIRATVTFGAGSPNGAPGLILPGIFSITGYELSRSSVAVPLPNIEGPSVSLLGAGLEMNGDTLLRTAGYLDVSWADEGVLELRGNSLIDTPVLRSDTTVADQVAIRVTGEIRPNATLASDPHEARPLPEPQAEASPPPPSGPAILAPGRHPDGLTVSDRPIVLAPGIHQFGGPGLQVEGDGVVTLDRAMVQLVGPDAAIVLRNAGQLRGAGIETGPWRHVALLAPLDGADWSIGQQASIDLDGDVYAPNRILSIRERGRLEATAAVLAGLRMGQTADAEFRGAVVESDERGPTARLVR